MKKKKYITVYQRLGENCPNSYINILNAFKEKKKANEFNYDYFMMLIQSVFTLDTDRHANNMFITNDKRNISLSPLIDFNRCFLAGNVLGDNDRTAKIFWSNTDFVAKEKKASMKYRFKNSYDISELIKYLKENNLYMDFISNQADNMSYEKDLKEYEDLIGIRVPRYIRKTFVGLGNVRQERIKKLISEPIIK